MIRVIPVFVLIGILVCITNLSASHTQALMAASDAPPPNYIFDWQTLIGTMGVTGVLVWYLWYTTAAAFPKIRDDYRMEMAEERAHHEKLHDKACERMERLCEGLESLSELLRERPCIYKKDSLG